jgi:UDP-2,4-diacetamido-2,4,6-trideoxy-beta-L-altropyranose hydrolase
MKIAIRADASLEIGVGHVMRCLTLARSLQNDHHDVVFLCKSLPEHLQSQIRSFGFTLHLLSSLSTHEPLKILKNQNGFDWLVVDHYSLGERWEKTMRQGARNIMVIDDLADRKHDCDLLLDQNLWPDAATRYTGLIDPECRRLIGPQYALIREEFVNVADSRQRDGVVQKGLVFLGGGDTHKQVIKILEGMQLLNRPDIQWDVVIGMQDPSLTETKETVSKFSNVALYTRFVNMAALMERADVAIASGGTTTWERCILGLPAFTVIMAENQKALTESLDAASATINLGWCADLTPKGIAGRLKTVLAEPAWLKTLGDNARGIMGGSAYQGAGGVARLMCETHASA